MLTPTFRCSQDALFVIVELLLPSIHCKLSTAQFDITDNQFTFHCSPYYLRLTFSHFLAQGKGERATYDLSTNGLKVFLPKLNDGEAFDHLDYPQLLLATRKQRVELLREDQAVPEEEVEEAEENSEDETEFVQTVPKPWMEAVVEEVATSQGSSYGFNGEFTNYFKTLDRSTTDAIVDLPDPDATSPAQRTVLRVKDENERFDEEAVFVALCDEDGDIAKMLQFRPWILPLYESALRAQRIRFLAPPMPVETGAPDEGATVPAAEGEEEDVPLDGPVDGQNVLVAWEGNVGSLDAPKPTNAIAGEVSPDGDNGGSDAVEIVCIPSRPAQRAQARGAASSGHKLACPSVKPPLQLTMEESALLGKLPKAAAALVTRGPLVDCLLVELLAVYYYDQYVTQGEGSVESIWTLSKLSPSLSWLDTADQLYDTCVSFVRRVLVFPEHRSFTLAMRCLRDAGLTLLCGSRCCLKVLLRLKYVFDHSETQFALSTLFINPMIQFFAYESSQPGDRFEARLERIAVELHDICSANEPFQVVDPKARASLSVADVHRTVEPIGPATLKLPFSCGW